MNISRRSFILGGAATVAAAGASSLLTGCASTSLSGIDFTKFETSGVRDLGLGLEEANNSEVPTKLYRLLNKNGAEACITNFGARVVSLMVPDKNGEFKDMVLGFDDIRKYVNFNNTMKNFHGAIIGRFANRIKDGKWTYNGNTYQVDINENDNSLHGGKFGFAYQTFEIDEYDPTRFIKMILHSDHGDMGFPGRMTTIVTYTLNDNNTLGITFEAKTTMPCPVNLMNHCYFCVSGDPSWPITEENLTIYSNAITPVDSELIPTGEIRPIQKGGVFDFFGESGEGKLVGRDINANDEQLKNGKGYDHNFVLMTREEAAEKGVLFDGKFEITDDGASSLNDKAKLAAKVKSNKSGITMTIVTTEPAIQLFDCHDYTGSEIGKNNKPMPKYAAMALEPQHYPDSPNHPNFPNTILMPGEVYRSKSEYRFTLN